MNRVLITKDPFIPERPPGSSFDETNLWPAHWISVAEGNQARPLVAAYTLPFRIKKAGTYRVHVSADERYELFLDGLRIGRGPERGDLAHWAFESHDLDLNSGAHRLTARVWSVGENAPFAQMTLAHGFLLAGEGPALPLLSTGLAPWKAKILNGYAFRDKGQTWATGDKVEIDGKAFSWGFQEGRGGGWKDVLKGPRGLKSGWHQDSFPDRRLKPATLPPMLSEPYRQAQVKLVEKVKNGNLDKAPVRARSQLQPEAAGWLGLLQGGSLKIPARTKRRVLVDFNDYLCAYTELKTSGGRGSQIRILWAESLYEEKVWWHNKKGNRDQWDGKYFHGVGDLFKPEGGKGRLFETLWWEAGRYLEIYVETGAQPLTLESLTFRETGYPLKLESSFKASDPRYEALTPLLFRTLRMDAHETYMDCPFYEQLQYVGDTRLEILTTYVSTLDDRLPRKALRLYDQSRLPDGFTQSRYPSRNFQVIPPFSLWWVGMVHDFALWRQDPAFVRQLLPGLRAVLEAFQNRVGASGLVEAPPGWNFVDWVSSWKWGIPPGGDVGISGLLNSQFILSLNLAAELEEAFGENEMARLQRRRAVETLQALERAFYKPDRGLFADDLDGECYSEHGQILPLLGANLPEAVEATLFRGLVETQGLSRCTYYFTHYFLEACRKRGRFDLLQQRLEDWFKLPSQGFRTTPENPEPTRSDCHAWGAHPLYHYFASILGIRPAGFGFRAVEIRPGLGLLSSASGKLVHPLGLIQAEFEAREGTVKGLVVLPPGLSGRLIQGGKTIPLVSGENRIS